MGLGRGHELSNFARNETLVGVRRKAAQNARVVVRNGLRFAKRAGQTISDYRSKAEKGDAVAQYMLGRSYRVGEGVPQDSTQAVYWYRKAAEQGHANAQNTLGAFYNSGEGTPQDYKQAVYWYRKAAEQGHATAQYNLGNRYYNGEGVTKDGNIALYWYEKAIKNEDGTLDEQDKKDTHERIERLKKDGYSSSIPTNKK